MNIDDYRIGFQTDIAAKINEGMLYDLGDVYSVTMNVTPVFNDQMGHISSQTIGMKTGVEGFEQNLNQVGQVHFINDKPYINRQEQFYNGRNLTTVYKSPNG